MCAVWPYQASTDEPNFGECGVGVRTVRVDIGLFWCPFDNILWEWQVILLLVGAVDSQDGSSYVGSLYVIKVL